MSHSIGNPGIGKRHLKAPEVLLALSNAVSPTSITTIHPQLIRVFLKYSVEYSITLRIDHSF